MTARLLRIAVPKAKALALHLGLDHLRFPAVQFHRVVALCVAKQMVLVGRMGRFDILRADLRRLELTFRFDQINT